MTETQNTTIQDFLKQELAGMTNIHSFEKLEGLKLKENAITEVEIDISKPFEKVDLKDANGKDVKKAILLVLKENGVAVKKNWWLNVKNPVYRELCELVLKGQKTFKILQTGRQQDTKYVLVKN